MAGDSQPTYEHDPRVPPQGNTRSEFTTTLTPFIMDELEIAAEDTISRTPEIIAATPGASADSTFHDRQLPPLNNVDCPNFPQFTVRIERLDAFMTARKYIRRDATIRGKVAVLNLTSDEYRAGGWRDRLCKTQVRIRNCRRQPYPPGRSDKTELSASHNNRKTRYATLPPCTSPSKNNTTLGQTSDQVRMQEFTPRRS